MNVFLWGFSGSGKTGIAMETVKIKVSHCKEKNKSVRVIVTKYSLFDDEQLLTNMREYLKNIDAQILTLSQLCKQRDAMNAVIIIIRRD